MSIRRHLLKIEPMAASLGVYVPAVVVQRSLGLLRTVLFIHIMMQVQFGLFGLGTMVFNVGSTLVALGSFNGIVRYVSFYQARGRLKEFYRAVAWKLTALAAALTAIAILLAPFLAGPAIGTAAGGTTIQPSQRVAIFSLSMLNAFLMAGYLNMTAWMRGLRVYRLLSLADVLYGALYLVLGLAALRMAPTAMAALIAHAVSIGVVLIGGLGALHWTVQGLSEVRIPGVPTQQVPDILSPIEDLDIQPGGAPIEPIFPEKGEPRHMLRRLLAFSAVSMTAVVLWQVQSYVSLWFVQRYHGETGSGLYQAFYVLCQMLPILATTVWAVVYSHVSVHWEQQQQALARSQLEVSFKVVVLALMVLGVALYLTVDLWAQILPPEFRAAKPLLPWLLMYFLGSSNLGYVYIASSLRERPSVSALMAGSGVVLNVLLAAYLVRGGQPLEGAVAGAKAAGVASLGCLLVGIGYLIVTRFGATWMGMLITLSPAVFLLSARWAGGVALAVIALALFSPWVFSAEEKHLLVRSVSKAARPILEHLRGRQA